MHSGEEQCIMMAEHQASIAPSETADEYARREQCLVDFKGGRFTLQACIPSFRHTTQTAEDRSTYQPKLRGFVLPEPHFVYLNESYDVQEDQVEAFLTQPQDPALRSPPLGPRLDAYTQLLIPVEPLDLGSDPDLDLKKYLGDISDKRSCQTTKWWLPLGSVRVERDEGLPLPSHINRLQSLLQREADIERLDLSDEASALEREVDPSTRSAVLREYADDLANPRPLHDALPFEHLTPPVSPISDDASPFIPNNGGNIIDLTSEPDSPLTEKSRLFRKGLEYGCLDSEPTAHPSLLASSPSQILPDLLDGPGWGCEGAKIDVPIVLTSSEAVQDEDVLAGALPPLPSEQPLNPQDGRETYFEDAFMSMLNDRGSYAQNLVGQEHFDPLDSVSRIQAPVLDFSIPSPEWCTKCSDAKSHFRWLQDEMGAGFAIHPALEDPGSRSALKWALIPHGNRDRRFPDEELTLSAESVEALIGDVVPEGSDGSFLIEQEMAILTVAEEIGDIPEPPTDDPTPPSSPVQGYGKNAKKLDPTQSAQPKGLLDQDWSVLLRSAGSKGNPGTKLLPGPDGFSATSGLVSGFMQLRGKKAQVLNPAPCDAIVSDILPECQSQDLASVGEPGPRSLAGEATKVLALAPEIDIPEERGSFIISLGLGRSIIGHLEALWTPRKLIDMDYSGTSVSSLEADISLSPTAGIIVTSLLKARQKALPGSKALTTIRERIRRVSQKYETLAVLVSECHPSGEFTGTLTPSDAAAYADFVSFGMALEDADVRVYLVPGAELTLAKWAVCLMCQHSHQAASVERFLSARETSWELFLRQAGMNVVAAKVLSGLLLEKAGPPGLARFLITSAEERISMFAGDLGEKTLRRCSRSLDRTW